MKYVRVQNADIMIVACPKHLKMIKDTDLKMQYETYEDIERYAKEK